MVGRDASRVKRTGRLGTKLRHVSGRPAFTDAGPEGYNGKHL